MTNVVVVESPAKAKTIEKYLGKDFKVLASYGHVRDLLEKDGAVDPEHGYLMKYAVAVDKEKHITAIASALKKGGAQLGDHLGLGHLVGEGEVVLDVHAERARREVDDVADGGHHLEVGAEVLLDGLGLGGRLDDDEGLGGHGRDG